MTQPALPWKLLEATTESITDSAPRERPTIHLGRRAFLWLLCGLSPLIILPHAEHLSASLLSLCINAVIVVLFAVDLARARRAEVHVSRHLPSDFRLGRAERVFLRLENRSPRALRIRLLDLPPDTIASRREILEALLPAHQSLEHTVHVVPQTRGRAVWEPAALRLETRWGLAAIQRSVCCATTIRVVPAFHKARISRAQKRDDVGVISQRTRSAQGTEVESLREYVQLDSLRSIDWKATSRRLRPMTRQYQAEQNQTLFLVLDASRTMAAPIHAANHSQDSAAPRPPTHFDMAVQSALELSAAALDAGDRVGLLVYGDARLNLTMPQSGRKQLARLVEQLTYLHAQPTQLAVRRMLIDLTGQLKRRALVVFFTDLENEAHAAQLCAHASMLTKRHLTVCVSLQDAATSHLARATPHTDAEVFQKAAAIDLLNDRERIARRLELRGIRVLQADAERLAPRLLKHYLHVKHRTLL